MTTIRIDLQKDLAGLEQTAAHVNDLRPALKTIGQLVRTSVVRNFEAGGRPSHWKPSKRAKTEGGQTLIDSGRLRQSIANRQPDVTTTTVEVGTNVVYAPTHQFGARKGEFGYGRRKSASHTLRHLLSKKGPASRKAGMFPIPWGDIPARPFMLLQDNDLPRIHKLLADHITGQA